MIGVIKMRLILASNSKQRQNILDITEKYVQTNMDFQSLKDYINSILTFSPGLLRPIFSCNSATLFVFS